MLSYPCEASNWKGGRHNQPHREQQKSGTHYYTRIYFTNSRAHDLSLRSRERDDEVVVGHVEDQIPLRPIRTVDRWENKLSRPPLHRRSAADGERGSRRLTGAGSTEEGFALSQGTLPPSTGKSGAAPRRTTRHTGAGQGRGGSQEGREGGNERGGTLLSRGGKPGAPEGTKEGRKESPTPLK